MDLGGVTLDLGGGNYSISDSVAFPDGFENYAITSGSLFASNAFPPAKHLIAIGSLACAVKFCSSTIRLQDLTLNGRHVAAGLISVTKAQYAMVGPAVMGYAFTQV